MAVLGSEWGYIFPAHEACRDDDDPARLREALGACGSQGISVPKSSPYYRGAVIFRDHCSGCHTLATVGAQGSATSIKNRLPTNGPNFNFRKENAEQVLFAIHNGGFSGAIMPENIVLGTEARKSPPSSRSTPGCRRRKCPP